MKFAEYADALRRRWQSHRPALVVVETLESTHALGRRIVQEYTGEDSSAPRLALVAWQQTAGRGRQGRRWSSPAGAGVYATLIQPLAAGEPIQTLPQRLAVAAAEVVNAHLDGRCRLKWPNDLLVGERKLGGILIDVLSQGGERSVAVASFGVNVRGDSETFAVTRATSLELEHATEAGLAELATELVAAAEDALPASAGERVGERYRELSVHRPGDPMRCRVGERWVAGTFLGFDANGFLRLRVGDEEQLLASGEIEDRE